MKSELIEICSKLKINPTQYILYKLIDDKDLPNTYKYVEEIGKFQPDDFKILLEKGYILPLKSSIGTKTDIGEFIRNTYELDGFLSTSVVEDILGTLTNLKGEEMFEELFDLYPNKVFLGGGRTGIAKACDKNHLQKLYLKSINNSTIKHNEVMMKLKTFIHFNNGYAKCNFDKFIKSEMWNQLDDLMNDSNNSFFDPTETK